MLVSVLGLLALGAARGAPGFVPSLDQAVVYEVNLRAMGSARAFRAVEKRLPAIQALGVNVLWLMPIQPVGKLRSAGGLGSPYALSDYTAVNPEFGSADDLHELVHAAHARKMAVILDWVGDHTAWDSAWIREHPDWYLHGTDGQIVSSPPGTNWRDVAALDYGSEPMRRQMIADMEYWITDFGFDGFRCDAADRLPDDFWKSAIGELRRDAKKPLLMLAEGFRTDDYADGFDLTYGWDFCSRLRQIYNGKPATELAKAASNERTGLAPGARRMRFITNHDISAWEGPLLELYKSPQGVRTAFALAALYGGTPLIYCGEESGWAQRIPIFDDSSIDWNQHPEDAAWIASVTSLRRTHAAFRTGTTEDNSTKDAVVFRRSAGQDEGLVLANVRNRAVAVPVPAEDRGAWVDGMNGQRLDLGDEVSLQPFQCLVLTNRR